LQRKDKRLTNHTIRRSHHTLIQQNLYQLVSFLKKDRKKLGRLSIHHY
jgi:hypothetical protein